MLPLLMAGSGLSNSMPGVMLATPENRLTAAALIGKFSTKPHQRTCALRRIAVHIAKECLVIGISRCRVKM